MNLGIKRTTKTFLGLCLGSLLLGSLIFTVPIFAATYEISPAGGNLIQNCTYELTIFADATGQSANAADLILQYSPSQIQVQDSNVVDAGVQLQVGSAFQAYVGNLVNTTTGRATLTAFSVSSNLTSKKPFAYVKFTPLTLGNIAIQIEFNGPGNTLDSNIADSVISLDLLTSVTNANFNVVNGSCSQDNVPPVIQFITPTNGGIDFNSNSIQVQISDPASGLALNTVQITINGVQYNINSPGLTYSQQGNTYLFTITLPQNIDPAVSGLIVVTAADNNGNNAAAQNLFNSGRTVNANGGAECVAPSILPNPEYIFKNTFLENTPLDDLVKSSVENLGPASTTALLTGALSLITLLPYLPILLAPGLFLNLLSVFFGAGLKRKWGIVVSRKDQSAVGFAICRLYIKDTNNLVAQTVTDSKGRYGFSVAAGEYRIEVSKDGFNMTKIDLIVTANKALNLKIELNPNGMQHFDLISSRLRYELAKFLRASLNLFTKLLMLLGFVFAVVGLFLNLNIINVVIFAIYTLLFILYVRQYFVRNAVDSIVLDVKSGLRIGNVRLHVHNLQSGEILDLIEVGQNGSFDYFGDVGEFGLSLQSYSYQLSSKNENLIKLKNLPALNVKLSTGGNRLKILVEEFTDVVDASNNGGKLANPFGD